METQRVTGETQRVKIRNKIREAESTLPVAGSTTVFGEATVQRVSARRRVKTSMKNVTAQVCIWARESLAACPVRVMFLFSKLF